MQNFSARLLLLAALVLTSLSACTAVPLPYLNGRSVYSENCVACSRSAVVGDVLWPASLS